MPKKISPKFRYALAWVGAVGAGGAAIAYAHFITQLDPFLALRGKSAGSVNPIDIEFRDVDMRHWHDGKFTTGGHIGYIGVTRDRDRFELNEVTHGTYRDAKFQFAYDGHHATWQPGPQLLLADMGVHVRSKDFDLHAAALTYDAQHKLLMIPGKVTGRLGDGDVTVQRVEYHSGNRTWKTGPIDWTGGLALDQDGNVLPQTGGTGVGSGSGKGAPGKGGGQSSAVKPKAQGDVAPAGGPKKWNIRSEESSSVQNGDHIVQVYTKMHATDGDIVITSPKGERDPETDIVTCEGPVKYWSAKANLVADHVVIYRKEKRAVLTGNVVMYVKPQDKQDLDEKMEVPPFKPMVPDAVSKDRPPAPVMADPHEKELDDDLRSSKTLKKYPSVIRAEKIVYYYKKGSRRAIITGSPQAQQELPGGRWRRLWTDHAFYDGEKEVLQLFSKGEDRGTLMKNSKGDDMVAISMVVSTKDDDETMSAKQPIANYFSDDDELNDASSKAGKDKKGGTTPPPTNPPGLSGPIGKGG